MENDKIISDFLDRNIKALASAFSFEITGEKAPDSFCVRAYDGMVYITANNYISAFHGFYCYLKKYCRIQLSHCANREIKLKKLVMFDGEYKKTIEQSLRVYMNYCTLCYSMCSWDFERWEKEIDFMAMNAINMPLAVVGSEAVLFETLLHFKMPENRALSCISGNTFWAWQLMTNITGYRPPSNKKYIYERLELGRKILKRYLEFGMKPIQQGFSGHIPPQLKSFLPDADIYPQNGWCGFEKTAQIDPTDPCFKLVGTVYLEKLKELMGAYGYYACDPFHEGAPMKKGKKYLFDVGSAISSLYTDFDKKSIWVMQSWSLNEGIVRAVSVDRLLILDINSSRTAGSTLLKKYPSVAGMLHNFGDKNAMQGKLEAHCKNTYIKLKSSGANTVGSGIFSEGVMQNPVIYELQLDLLTRSDNIDAEAWINDYIERRYGSYDENLRRAWDILLKTCYKSDGYHENEVGSAVASKPQLKPKKTGPCCHAELFYDPRLFEKAPTYFLCVSDKFKSSDGYQYDLCDITRQALSNLFEENQLEFARAYKRRDKRLCFQIAEKQKRLIIDIDKITSHRTELSLSSFLYNAQHLACDEDEKRYFTQNSKLLITLWGNTYSSYQALHDYSWKEWSGMLADYYLPRWDIFYSYAIESLNKHKRLKMRNIHSYGSKKPYKESECEKAIRSFENKWYLQYREYKMPADSDVTADAKKALEKYFITEKQHNGN